jgi:hypothetical protein
MKYFLIKIFLVLFAIALAFAIYLMFSGPHMLVQPIIKTYQAEMPLMDSNTIAQNPIPPVPSEAIAAKLKNPLEPTPQNLVTGKTYYTYYCLACHNDNGDGFGPVGYSYVPVPADLRSKKIASYSDGQIVRKMLLGPGHQPVLNRIVPADYRWHLALYVKELNRKNLPTKKD